jgi:hygromycin-B 4-O-kinase
MTNVETAPQTELEDVVRNVVARHVAAPTRVAPLRGGLSNHAFDVETDHEQVVVRLADQPDKLEGYERERQAADRARALGVPTQEVVAIGQEGAWTYSIARRLAGDPAMDHPDRLSILEELGRIARAVHGIRTVGFGPRFTWDEGGIGQASARSSASNDATWAEYLRHELRAHERLDRLAGLGMIEGRQEESLRQTLAEVEAWTGPSILNHGDLRLKNVVVGAEGHILGLIDWESSVSVVGPHWDLSIALHDLSIDAKQAFLTGYGLSDEEIRQAAPTWRLFNVLNYVPRIDQLVDADDTAELDRVRTRLSGALDLYAADRDPG